MKKADKYSRMIDTARKMDRAKRKTVFTGAVKNLTLQDVQDSVLAIDFRTPKQQISLQKAAKRVEKAMSELPAPVGVPDVVIQRRNRIIQILQDFYYKRGRIWREKYPDRELNNLYDKTIIALGEVFEPKVTAEQWGFKKG